MPKKSSDFEFRQQTSLSQRVSFLIDMMKHLAGSDPETSLAIANLRVLGQNNIINLEDPGIKLLLDMLDGRRLALFATSEKTNEISKMGFMLPVKESVFDGV